MSAEAGYVRRSIDAAFRLALRDERAWSEFDLTVGGFYRSFAAILVVAPLNILLDIFGMQLAAGQHAERKEPISTHVYDMSDAVFSTLALCAQWMVFPLAMIVVTRFFRLDHRYSALIIAHNWGTVVVALFNLPPFLLYSAGLVSVDQAFNLSFIVLGLTLYYRYYIAQTALGAGWSTALSITTLELVLQVYFISGLALVAGLWLPTS
jgi:hypothetical protein